MLTPKATNHSHIHTQLPNNEFLTNSQDGALKQLSASVDTKYALMHAEQPTCTSYRSSQRIEYL